MEENELRSADLYNKPSRGSLFFVYTYIYITASLSHRTKTNLPFAVHLRRSASIQDPHCRRSVCITISQRQFNSLSTKHRSRNFFTKHNKTYSHHPTSCIIDKQELIYNEPTSTWTEQIKKIRYIAFFLGRSIFCLTIIIQQRIIIPFPVNNDFILKLLSIALFPKHAPSTIKHHVIYQYQYEY